LSHGRPETPNFHPQLWLDGSFSKSEREFLVDSLFKICITLFRARYPNTTSVKVQKLRTCYNCRDKITTVCSSDMYL
jgi:hypothetical protein